MAFPIVGIVIGVIICSHLKRWIKMRLNGKNIKIKRGTAALVVALALSMGAISCSSEKIPEVGGSLNSTMMTAKNNTVLDDVLKVSGQDYGTLSELYELDRAITIYEILENIDLEKYSYILSEEEIKNLDRLPASTVEIMPEVLQDENESEVNRLNAGRWLNYLQNDAESIIENASPIIIEAGLTRAIKAGVVDALDLSPEEFSSVTIGPETADEGNYMFTVSGQNRDYSADGDSIYGKMIKHLYDIQKKENRGFGSKLGQSKEALNLIKVSAYSEAKLIGDEITSKINYGDIRALQKSNK